MFNPECDKCGKVVKGVKGQQAKLPKDWYELTYGKYSNVVTYHLCPECKGKLGIPATAPDESVSTKLLDILAEFVREEAEEVVSTA